ncbi:2814_t:CDS:10 [Acaulospora colombiana]|uniref:2814_t:CDS:1 n=1 Tax=Acaulospora colombiana TaxID=27376 RepID=A0ACA9LWC8_9GLOM|nr:2814_t:CDS:10 [Acaulospora colombiana]
MNTSNHSSSSHKLSVPDIMLTVATPLSATSAAFKACIPMAEDEVQDPDKLQIPSYKRIRTSSHKAPKNREQSEPLKRSASSPTLAVVGQVPRIIPPTKAEPKKRTDSSEVTKRFAAKAPWSNQGTGPAKLNLSFWRTNSAAPKRSASISQISDSRRLRDEETQCEQRSVSTGPEGDQGRTLKHLDAPWLIQPVDCQGPLVTKTERNMLPLQGRLCSPGLLNRNILRHPKFKPVTNASASSFGLSILNRSYPPIPLSKYRIRKYSSLDMSTKSLFEPKWRKSDASTVYANTSFEMAQIYQEEDDAALNQPLLGNSRRTEPRTPNRKEGKAQLRSSVGNLANTILGTGMLSFPLAMASGGLIPDAVPTIIIFCGVATDLSECVSLGLMPSVVESLYHNLLPSDPPEWALSGRMWISMFMVILVPLCFLRDLHSLRHTSYVALFSVGMIERGEVHLIHFTPSFIANFPVQLFPIYNELKSNTQERMNIVIGSSIGGACIIYEIVAVLGYLTFGSKVGANIMAMYPATSLFIAFGQLAIVILVLFSYPLQVHPCRNCLDKIVDAVFKKQQPTSTPVANGNGHAEHEEDEDADYDHGAHDEAGPLRHTLLTAAIIISGFSIAYFVNSLQIGSFPFFSLLPVLTISLQSFPLSGRPAQLPSPLSSLDSSSRDCLRTNPRIASLSPLPRVSQSMGSVYSSFEQFGRFVTNWYDSVSHWTERPVRYPGFPLRIHRFVRKGLARATLWPPVGFATAKVSALSAVL